MTRRAVLAIGLVALAAAAVRAEQRDISFPARDGFTLHGTFYSVAKGGPGILLLHQCNADRRSYDQLALMLNTAGYNVLSFDFRGFGGSRAGQYTDFSSQRQAVVEKMPGDVDAALTFLTAQNTVIARALGVVGGSCGVNQAIHASLRHPDVRTLVLLSGGTNADGEAHIKASRQLPIFGVASAEDGSAPASIQKIVGLSAHPDSRVKMLKNAGHAAEMLARQEDLAADVVIWFRANLPVAGYGLPPAIR
jgi:pimeloyl-ACP methyl ester carboxylesterase